MSRRSRKQNRAMRAQAQITNEIVKESNTMGNNTVVHHVEGSAAYWTEIRQMPIGKLEIDPTYQRPLNVVTVKHIIANFNPDLVNVLKVSYRDGHYYVFDGQHTLEALKQRFRNDSYPAMCKVFHGLKWEDEARLFADQFGEARDVPYAYKLRALEIAGDKDVMGFLKATRDHGYTIEPGKHIRRTNGIEAVKKAYDCYHALGDYKYGAMLDLLKNTWHGEPWSVTQNMLAGMCQFMKIYGDTANTDRFVKKLSHLTDGDITRCAGQFYELPVPYRYARAIATFYNKGGAKGALKLMKLTVAMCGE